MLYIHPYIGKRIQRHVLGSAEWTKPASFADDRYHPAVTSDNRVGVFFLQGRRLLLNFFLKPVDRKRDLCGEQGSFIANAFPDVNI